MISPLTLNLTSIKPIGLFFFNSTPLPLLSSNFHACPIKDYEQFTQMILDISKKTIPIKHNNLNNFPPSLPWWNSSCP